MKGDQEKMIIQEKLLFVAHRGQVGGHPAGILISNHCLPVAVSHVSEEGLGAPVAESGIMAAWESCTDVDEFFREILDMDGVLRVPGETGYLCGLWVYETEYDSEMVDDEDAYGEWEWLQGGDVRRPTPEELEPLTRGGDPWGGRVL